MQSKEILSFFARYIEEQVGIIYADHNYFQLENRLEQIAKYQGVNTLEELYKMAQKEISFSFQSMLLDVATNNETSFYRDTKVFKSIEIFLLQNILPHLSKGKTLYIWSAACSTGQEPVSIAILLNELKSKFDFNFKILASDISSTVLEKAQSGVYSQLEVQRGLPAPLMIKYFKKDQNDKWHLDPQILKTIEYKKINLKNFHLNHDLFQIIFCRNILIYQKVDQKAEIVRQLSRHLLPDGIFMMGSGETMIGISQEFTQTPVEGSILYMKKSLPSKAA